MRIGPLGVLAAALSLAAMLTGCGTSDLHTARRDAHAEASAGAPLRVVTANGHITVRPGTGDGADVRAEIRATTPERLAATSIATERLQNGTLVISVAWPGGVREPKEGCSLDITLPPAQGVELRTTNGRIEVDGMGGTADLSTTNASVDVVDHAGGVRADTTNGQVHVGSPQGPVRVQTSNGSVTVKQAPAAVDVETSNGGVEVSLDAASSGPVRVRTDNARVDLRVGRAFRGELALKTSNGSVKFDSVQGAEILSTGGAAARLRFGQGGDLSTVQTSNASIRVSGGDRAARGGGAE